MTGSYPDYIDPAIGLPLIGILALICWIQRAPDRRAARAARKAQADG